MFELWFCIVGGTSIKSGFGLACDHLLLLEYLVYTLGAALAMVLRENESESESPL